jgi:hypothetical protein
MYSPQISYIANETESLHLFHYEAHVQRHSLTLLGDSFSIHFIILGGFSEGHGDDEEGLKIESATRRDMQYQERQTTNGEAPHPSQ